MKNFTFIFCHLFFWTLRKPSLVTTELKTCPEDQGSFHIREGTHKNKKSYWLLLCPGDIGCSSYFSSYRTPELPPPKIQKRSLAENHCVKILDCFWKPPFPGPHPCEVNFILMEKSSLTLKIFLSPKLSVNTVAALWETQIKTVSVTVVIQHYVKAWEQPWEPKCSGFRNISQMCPQFSSFLALYTLGENKLIFTPVSHLHCLGDKPISLRISSSSH